MSRVLFLGKGIVFREVLVGNITYIPDRVDRARDISLIHESHFSETEKVAS